MFLRIFQHLLPRARAWSIVIDKPLRRLFEGLTGIGTDVKAFLDDIYLDIFPQTTRALSDYEYQFGLPMAALTEQQRRDRLAARWQALGGQSPAYIEDTLRGAGFDVYVHEWWAPGTEPVVGVKTCTAPRNPFAVLRPTSTGGNPGVDCGEPLAACGEPEAQCGNVYEELGYPLVNKVLYTTYDLTILAGDPLAACGEPTAQCGERTDYYDAQLSYTLPTDVEKWHYFLYIGAATYGDLAQIPDARRNEFETRCLNICPAQLWLGIMVEYI